MSDLPLAGRAGNFGLSFPDVMTSPSQFIPSGFTITMSDPIGKKACGVSYEIMGFSLDWTLGAESEERDKELLTSVDEFDEHYRRQSLGEDMRLTPEEMRHGALRQAKLEEVLERKRRKRMRRELGEGQELREGPPKKSAAKAPAKPAAKAPAKPAAKKVIPVKFRSESPRRH
jgi:hypothetical protein